MDRLIELETEVERLKSALGMALIHSTLTLKSKPIVDCLGGEYVNKLENQAVELQRLRDMEEEYRVCLAATDKLQNALESERKLIRKLTSELLKANEKIWTAELRTLQAEE